MSSIACVCNFNAIIVVAWICSLNDWKANIDKQQGFTEVEKKTMMLSRETIEGLATGYRFGAF